MVEEMNACVACAEEIRAQALLCKFCKTRQDDESFTSPIKTRGDLDTDGKKLQRILFISGSAAAVFALVLWAGLAAVFSARESRANELATSSQAAVNDSEPVTADGLNPSNAGSNTLSPSNENSGQPNRNTGTAPPSTGIQPKANDLQAQRQEALRQIAEQAAIWEAESRAKAIQDYETKRSNYLNRIADLESQMQQLYIEESASYAQWEARWGFPFNRNDSVPCGYTSDMFTCIHEHANMPRYWHWIPSLESQIRHVENEMSGLVSPY